MHIHNLERLKHSHNFALPDPTAQRKVMLVVGLTLITMVVELTTGLLFGSMALLADGWHMGTHAVALGITALAYFLARKYAHDRRFAFGTGKIGVLGGFTSAVVLTVAAVLMAVESIERLFAPQAIRFNEAITVAFAGLAVNLVSAVLLNKTPAHDDPAADSDAHRGDHDHHHDHNMRGAYLHVIADALTSVLAIVALFAGKFWGWSWLDPLIGVVGALIITHWAKGLLRDTGKILLDRDVSRKTIDQIVTLVEAEADNRIIDLHLWKVGSNQSAAIISIVTHYPRPAEHYKTLLSPVQSLAHVTVEVVHCTSEPCMPVTFGGA